MHSGALSFATTSNILPYTDAGEVNEMERTFPEAYPFADSSSAVNLAATATEGLLLKLNL